MKKIIIAVLVAIVILALVTVGLFFFLNRNKEQDVPPEPIETQDPIETPAPTPPPTPSVSYMDMYESKTLPGVEFNVPKSMMAEGVAAATVSGSHNGKTIIYQGPNSFAIKKIGSFMMGISAYQKAGVYDSMYVSSITGAKKLQITEDFAFNFDDINFNSTSFNVSRATGQKRSVMSVKMVEPEYTNDVYEGYIVLVVNSQNQGYLAFIATAGTDIMKVDVQSMVNSIALTGDTIFIAPPVTDPDPVETQEPPEPVATDAAVNFEISNETGRMIIQSGEVFLRDQATGKVFTGVLRNTDGKAAGKVTVPTGTYGVMGTLSVKTSEDAMSQTLRIIFDNPTIEVSEEKTVKLDVSKQRGGNISTSLHSSWVTMTFYGTDGSPDDDVEVTITRTDGTEVGSVKLKKEEMESASLSIEPGVYTAITLVNGSKVDSQEITLENMGVTQLYVMLGDLPSVFVTPAPGSLNIE